MSIEKSQVAGEWREAGEHLIWVGREKVSQHNKSTQLILRPKLEAIPSTCQKLEKKLENLNCRHMLLAPQPPNWTKHLQCKTATLCHENTLLIWQPPLEFCSWNNLFLGVFAHLLKGASKSDPQRQHNYRNGKVKAAVMQSWSSLRINFPLQNSAAFCVVAYIGL